jgi:hypothetical protein
LANWQRLCRDLGIEDELPSISKCWKVCFTEQNYFIAIGLAEADTI